jgi:hypothetical protein
MEKEQHTAKWQELPEEVHATLEVHCLPEWWGGQDNRAIVQLPKIRRVHLCETVAQDQACDYVQAEQ